MVLNGIADRCDFYESIAYSASAAFCWMKSTSERAAMMSARFWLRLCKAATRKLVPASCSAECMCSRPREQLVMAV